VGPPSPPEISHGAGDPLDRLGRTDRADRAGRADRLDRLDLHVAAAYGLPRNQVQQWIRDGRVRVNGRAGKAAGALAAGDRIECEPPPPRTETMVPEAADLVVLHEDAGLTVLDKPAGLAVHPGAGRATGTLAHRLLARYPEMAGVGGPGRPGIVHRLDRGTSGVMVAARTAAAYQRLSRAFAGRTVAKRYLAIVYGRPAAPAGVIEAPIGRHPERRKEMTVRRDGRPARTGYRTLAAQAGIALLELDLATGRTHQIRVHLKSLGHPLVGDPVYGEARHRALPRPVQAPLRDFPRPALHSWRLWLPHGLVHGDTEGGAAAAAGAGAEPEGWMLFEAPVPQDLRDLWQTVTGTPLPDLPAAAPPRSAGGGTATPAAVPRRRG
jgi:23S rRNA pseudouridine1911/1915/1917 synthase